MQADVSTAQKIILNKILLINIYKGKGKVIPLQAPCDPEGG